MNHKLKTLPLSEKIFHVTDGDDDEVSVIYDDGAIESGGDYEAIENGGDYEAIESGVGYEVNENDDDKIHHDRDVILYLVFFFRHYLQHCQRYVL